MMLKNLVIIICFISEIDFTINALSPVNDPNKISGVVVYCGDESEAASEDTHMFFKPPTTPNDKNRLHNMLNSGADVTSHRNRLKRFYSY